MAVTKLPLNLNVFRLLEDDLLDMSSSIWLHLQTRVRYLHVWLSFVTLRTKVPLMTSVMALAVLTVLAFPLPY